MQIGVITRTRKFVTVFLPVGETYNKISRVIQQFKLYEINKKYCILQSSILDLSESTVCVSDADAEIPYMVSFVTELHNEKGQDLAVNNNDVDEIDSITFVKAPNTCNQSTPVENSADQLGNGATQDNVAAQDNDTAESVEREPNLYFSWLHSSSAKTTSAIGFAFLAALGFFLLRRFRQL